MGFMKLLFILSLVSLVNLISCSKHHFGRSVSNECPPDENIPKCKCKVSKGLSVSCNSFESDAELHNHLKNLQGYSIKQLEIKNYEASSIPTNLWRGLEIEELLIQRVEVSDASFRRGKRHFQGLEKSLEVLEIKNSFRNGYRPLLNLQLDHLENLKNVILERNEIHEIGNDWFTTGPKELSVLILEGNGIEELGYKAFSALNNLRLLAVSGNHFRTISRGMLPSPANHLDSLDLSYNNIRTLPADIFSDMPALQEVSLENNLINVIDKTTWGSISSQLTTLKLGGNVLHCDDSMQWICDTKLKSTHGKCSTPYDKRGLPLQEFCKRIM